MTALDHHVALTPLAEAQRLMIDHCVALEAVKYSPLDAVGAVAAETVQSAVAVPSFINSAMDGYAVRSEDCSRPKVQLVVTGTTLAGAAPGPSLAAGCAVRIMTGAPLPRGADAVCPIEQATQVGDSVVINVAVPPGRHVRQPGEDILPGTTVLECGKTIDPVTAGLLCAVGVEKVSVIRRPAVGVLSTGDELLPADRIRSPVMGSTEAGMIHDTNRVTLLGLVSQCGFPVTDLGVVGDDEDQLVAALMDAAERCDVIITTGGVSVGDRDHVRGCISRLPARTARSLQVAIKPGKPQVFVAFDEPKAVLFGLPGNPVSAVVSFELFVRPALRSTAGHRWLFRPHVNAIAGEGLTRRADGKLHLRPVTLDHVPGGGSVQASSPGERGSHVLSSLAGADALALLPDGPGAAPGEEVICMALRPEWAAWSGSAAGSERAMTQVTGWSQ